MADLFPSDVDPRLLEEVTELLYRVNRRLRRRATEQLGRLGLTPAQARALRAIGRVGGPLRMSGLADRLHIARRSATSVVDELVEHGLVERQDDPADRRATVVVLTRQGARALRSLAELRHQALADLATGLSSTELSQLRDGLARLDRAAPDHVGPATDAAAAPPARR